MLSEEEQDFLTQLAEIDPTSPALIPLVRSYLAAGDPERALEMTDRIVAAHPYFLEAAVLAGRAWLDLGQKDRAASFLGNNEYGLAYLAGIIKDLSTVYKALGASEQALRLERASDILRPEAGAEDMSAKQRFVKQLNKLLAAARRRRRLVEASDY